MTDHRAAMIVQLLEQLPELTDPVRAGNGDGSTGLLLMPHASYCRVARTPGRVCSCHLRSAVEVWRLLQVMRDSATLVELRNGTPVTLRHLWWNLNERYLRCATSTRDIGWRAGRYVGLEPYAEVVAQPGGWKLAIATERTRKRKGATTIRVRVVTWDPQVRRDTLDRAVAWLSANWALDVEPMLPRELMAA